MYKEPVFCGVVGAVVCRRFVKPPLDQMYSVCFIFPDFKKNSSPWLTVDFSRNV